MYTYIRVYIYIRGYIYIIFPVVDWRRWRWWWDLSTIMKPRVLNPWVTALITTPTLTLWLHFPLNSVLVLSGLISHRINRPYGFYLFISLSHTGKRRNLKLWVPEFASFPNWSLWDTGVHFPCWCRDAERTGQAWWKEEAVWGGKHLSFPPSPFSECANNQRLFH